jgi:hypothetical protein
MQTEAPVKRLQISPKAVKVAAAAVAVVAALAVVTSLVYLRPPTDPLVRRFTSILPYPAAVVGTDVIAMSAYLEERDALNTYFENAATETGTKPSEEEITQNIMDTLVHKAAVRYLAREAGVELDEARVDAFYQEAVGGADQEEFSTQLEAMFGWTPEEFRSRVVTPVVLAMQMGEQVAGDAERQAGRRAEIDAAYGRLQAGEDFAAVATTTSSDFSGANGGDVGYLNLSDIPEEWKTAIEALPIGSYSEVVEGTESFIIFKVTDRITAGEDSQVKLSVITVPKVTLEEAVQEYLDSVRVWKFIGRA